MRQYRLVLFLLFIAGNGLCQDSAITVTGKVIDIATKKSIGYASILLQNSITGTLADSLGNFKITVQMGSVLKVSAVGYETGFISIRNQKPGKILVSLKNVAGLLNAVTVNPSLVEAVSKSKNSNVLDYDFYDDNILLITFRNTLTKSKLVLLNPLFDTLAIIALPEEPVYLFKDCFGNSHIVCENRTYQVFYNGSLQLLKPQTIKDFEAFLMPCVATDSSTIFLVKKYGSEPVDVGFHVFNSNNLGLHYSFIHKQTRLKKELVTIEDESTVKMRKDEENFERMKAQSGLSAFGDRLFAETILFKEIYAPLYIINHKTYVFDYVNNRINTYSATGKEISSITINYHIEKAWKRMMCVDVKANKAYSVYEKDGITKLKCIDLTNGSISSTHKIPFVFVHHIKIRDNYVYYLHKGKEYDATCYLSRIRLF